MSVRNLDKIFAPQKVAVIGASDTPGKVGYTVLKNLAGGAFGGTVVPVNATRKIVQGLPACRALDEISPPADLAIVCTPAATVPDLIRQCGRAGTMGAIVLSAGFREVGPAGAELEARVRQAAAEFPGLRILGPNCLGVLAPHVGLNASFAPALPAAGRVAFLSQSGALCTSVLDWAIEGQIGFSLFVSMGNMLDVALDDLLDYLADDPKTDSVILYVESVTDAREFMSAARGIARRKPVVAYKAGRFAQSAQAAASHTGAMAGVDAVYDAAFARAGIVRVFDVEGIFDCAELLARQRHFSGDRLAILTNAGGPGVMATDALLEQHGQLAALSPASKQILDATLPPFWSHGNPVDVLGDATPERLGRALDVVLADGGVDAALVILTPQAMTDPLGAAREVAIAARKHAKPVLASWMGGPLVREGARHLSGAGLPTYATPEQAVRAFMKLVEYARRRETLYETPRAVPVTFPIDRNKVRIKFEALATSGPRTLSEQASKELLEAYGIPVTRTYAAHTPPDAILAAHTAGYPVVLKILSPDITHKSDVGGVALNLANDEEVRAAFHRLVQSARKARPEARIDGVTVQRMAAAAHARELILGARRDPVFGMVMLAGLGGVAAEVLQDRALALPPLNERLARRMLESLRTWKLLQPFRGRPGVAVDRLIEILLRFSYLVADHPQIEEIDVNPLLATPDDVLALDARIILSAKGGKDGERPFSHLAIRPYPDEWERSVTLKGGETVLLRPIRPEDEPAWHDLLRRCSPETLWSRFRHLFKESTHEMAMRFCFIDYDREMALVAEREEGGEKRIVAVGRLVSDADRETAEYAVLVADAWQGRGLGGQLTDGCLEIARRWGMRRVIAETSPNNTRMLATFRHRGFECRPRDDVVFCTNSLAGNR